jgi:hypothetical protein
MFLTRVFSSGRSVLAALTATAVALLLSAAPAGAQALGRPYIPPDAKPYQRLLIEQEHARWQALPRRAAEPSFEAPWRFPPGAPARGTYSWYAPPRGYKVIREATPSAPQEVTVVGPDGSKRTFLLEGPVVMRLRYVFVGNTSK